MGPSIGKIERDIAVHYGLDECAKLLLGIIVQAIEDASYCLPEPTSNRWAKIKWRADMRASRTAQHWLQDRGYLDICALIQVPPFVIDEAFRLFSERKRAA